MSTQDKNAVVIIDEVIGDEEVNIRVYADLRYISDDIMDYTAKLRRTRGIPANPETIALEDPLIDVVAAQIELPENNRKQTEIKNKRIREEIIGYYEKQNRAIEVDATMLSVTMENVFTEEPTPYESQESNRVRPGLINIADPVKNLQDPVERRLKQLQDKLLKKPDIFLQFQQAMEAMSIDARRRLTVRDRDGFQPSGPGDSVPDGDGTVDEKPVE